MAAVPREYHEYVFPWLGRNIFFTDGGSNGVPASGVQVSTGFLLPRNALIWQVMIFVVTPFNAVTTNTLDIGTAANPTALVSAQTLAGAGAFLLNTNVAAGFLSATQDVEIFTRYNFTGAAPTAGSGRVAVKFVVDPDRRK